MEDSTPLIIQSARKLKTKGSDEEQQELRILVDFKGTLAGYQDGQRLIEAQTHMFSWAQPMLYLPLKVMLVAQMEFVKYYIISYVQW